MQIILFAIIAFLYVLFGIIDAIVMGILIINDNMTDESPLEYWLMIFLTFVIWPFFFGRTVVDTIRIHRLKKNRAYAQNLWIKVDYGKGIIYKCTHCGHEIDISQITPKFCPKCGIKNGKH